MIPLAVTTDGVWHPGIGDPTIFGWLITVAYVTAAAVCCYAWRRELRAGRNASPPAAARAGGFAILLQASSAAPDLPERRRGHISLMPRFWLVLSVVMLLLGINKQLDLQTLLTQTGRSMAKSEGWYAVRARVQVGFFAGLAVLGLIIVGVSWWWVRRARRRYALAIGGITFLTCFILLRASSFHHVDTVLFHLPILEAWVNRLLELGGIALVAVAAARTARSA